METNEKLNEVAETLGEINYIPTVTEEKYKDVPKMQFTC